jgi:hypothetical protein
VVGKNQIYMIHKILKWEKNQEKGKKFRVWQKPTNRVEVNDLLRVKILGILIVCS